MQETQADVGLIPGLGSYPGGGLCDPLQYSCLENRMDRGAWWAAVHGVTKTILVFLPVKIHRPRSLAGYNPWGRKESDTIERLNTSTHNFLKLKCNQQQRWTSNLSLIDSKHVPSTSLLCCWLMRQKETTFALWFFFSHINSKGSSCLGCL